jgi:uncharacterized Zn finger protein
MSPQDSLKIPIKCPKCGEEFKRPVGGIQPGTDSIRCPSCGTVIELGVVADDLQRIADAFRNLRKVAKKRR